MRTQVKEFFNNLQKQEEKETQHDRVNKKRRRTAGVAPYNKYNIPSITNFSHFMECEVAENICPLMWENLEIDFENKDRKYCSVCDKHVYKVDNQYMLEQCKSENKCMAISNELLEKMNGKMEYEEFENLERRLVISKLFLHKRKENPNFFDRLEAKKLSYEEQLKEILLDILENDMLEKYSNFSIDFESIFEYLFTYGNDEIFNKHVFDKIKSLQN